MFRDSDPLDSLLLSDHPVTLDVDHDVLDVGVAGPAVLLHDAHLAGPQAVGVGDDGVRVDLHLELEWRTRGPRLRCY